MARRYGTQRTDSWPELLDDDRNLSKTTVILYCYLATGPHSTRTGFIRRLRPRVLAVELRSSARAIHKGLQELAEAGLITYDPETRDVHVHNGGTTAPPRSVSSRTAFERELQAAGTSLAASQAREEWELYRSQCGDSGSTVSPQSRDQDQDPDQPGSVPSKARPAQRAAPAPKEDHPSKAIYDSYTRWMVQWKKAEPGRAPQVATRWTKRTGTYCRKLWDRAASDYDAKGIEFQPTNARHWDRFFERVAKELTWFDSARQIDLYWLTNTDRRGNGKGMPEVWEALVTGEGFRSSAPRGAPNGRHRGAPPPTSAMHEDDVTEWKTAHRTLRDPTREELQVWLQATGRQARSPDAPVRLPPPQAHQADMLDDDCPI